MPGAANPEVAVASPTNKGRALPDALVHGGRRMQQPDIQYREATRRNCRLQCRGRRRSLIGLLHSLNASLRLFETARAPAGVPRPRPRTLLPDVFPSSQAS